MTVTNANKVEVAEQFLAELNLDVRSTMQILGVGTDLFCPVMTDALPVSVEQFKGMILMALITACRLWPSHLKLVLPWRLLGKQQVIDLLLDGPFRTEHHSKDPPAKDPYDFDERTGIWKCVKRGDVVAFYLPHDVPAFGIYLGVHNAEHVVLVRDVRDEVAKIKVHDSEVVSVMCGEAFPTLDELKQRWRLD